MDILNNKSLIAKTPLVTCLLMEWGNLGQIFQMMMTQSAKSQNLLSWWTIHLALWLWYNYYRVVTPDQKLTIRITLLGIFIQGLGTLTVSWFKFYGM